MSKYIILLDSCHYSSEDNGTCILKGWMYTGNEKPEIQVRADHEKVDFSAIRIPRHDVIAAKPKLDFPDVNAGFEIRIPNLEYIFSNFKALRVRVSCEKEKYPLLEKSTDRMKKEYQADTIRFFMELEERRLDTIYLQGWCINTFGNLEMKVLTEEGKLQEKVHIKNIRRPDLPEQFGVKPEECHGFVMELPRAAVEGKKIQISFKNEVTQKVHMISMPEFDRKNTQWGRMLQVIKKEGLKKNVGLLKSLGVKNYFDYIQEESCSVADAYVYYEKKHRATAAQLKAQKAEKFEISPLYSIIVPLYKTPENFLKELIDSVIAQSYEKWQLCLADGSPDDALSGYIKKHYKNETRIVYKHLESNDGISGNTNAAWKMTTGDYIVFADHDDVISPEALYEVTKIINEHNDAELIYSDEDVMDEKGNKTQPHFKPDFNLDYLRCNNYICHLVAIKKELMDKVGGLRKEFDGAQDFDFLLRCAENTEKIYHIPKVLYHWRAHEGSTAGNQDSKQYAIDAGKRALEAHYKRLKIEAEVEYTGIFIVFRTKYKIIGNPKVSILIPNKDHIEDLEKCIASIEEKSTWRNFEIIVIENNSEEEKTFEYYEKLKKRFENIKIVKYEGSFNYSAINNFGAKYAKGDYYLLLNNDTEVITPDWLEQMVGCCQREDVAITGAKLFYPDQTVQHAGVVVGMGGFAGHILTGYGRNYTGYMGRLIVNQSVSAVTGACLMVKASIYKELNGLDEEFAVALNDVDFCLRAGNSGKKVVFLPGVELYHYESKSRGFETTPEKKKRFQKEIDRFQSVYKELLEKGDPYYNPNLTVVRGDCSLKNSREKEIIKEWQ